MAPSRAALACLCILFVSQGTFCMDGLNVATVNVTNDCDVDLIISMKSSNCYKCKEVFYGKDRLPVLESQDFLNFSVDTRYPLTIFFNLSEQTNDATCNGSVHYHYIAKAEYAISYNKTSKTWEVHMVHKGENTYMPILWATLICVSLAIVWVTLCSLYRYMQVKGYLRYLRLFSTNSTDRLIHRERALQKRDTERQDLGVPKAVTPPPTTYGSSHNESESLVKKVNASLNSGLIAEGTSESPEHKANGHLPSRTATVGVMSSGDQETNKNSPKTSSTRLKSLDSFRGFSLVIMIFVNYGGGGYWFFNHSKWNGLTVADLVFPWFIWIMGVSIVFSYKGRKKDSFWMRLYQVFRRTVILFALGLFLNVEATPFDSWRVPGVLQRFSATYFVVAITELSTSELYAKYKFTIWKPVRDLTNNWVQWIIIFTSTLVWLLVTFLLPLPHPCPRGYIGPGGLADSGEYESCTGGAARVIDHLVFTDDHMYQHPTAKELYLTEKAYEPEGILGTLTSIVLCFLGVQAGRILTHYRGKHLSIIIRFILWGISLGVLGTILCLGMKNEGPIPINKNLWSLSFILVMAGTGCIVFISFYVMIDALDFWNGSPFRYPGMNSIIVYVGHEVFEDYFPFSWVGHRDSHASFLASNLIGTCAWMIIAYYWYLIGFFVKI